MIYGFERKAGRKICARQAAISIDWRGRSFVERQAHLRRSLKGGRQALIWREDVAARARPLLAMARHEAADCNDIKPQRLGGDLGVWTAGIRDVICNGQRGAQLASAVSSTRLTANRIVTPLELISCYRAAPVAANEMPVALGDWRFYID